MMGIGKVDSSKKKPFHAAYMAYEKAFSIVLDSILELFCNY